MIRLIAYLIVGTIIVALFPLLIIIKAGHSFCKRFRNTYMADPGNWW